MDSSKDGKRKDDSGFMLMIIPNKKGRFVKVTFTTSKIYTILVSLIVFVVLFTFLGVSFFRNLYANNAVYSSNVDTTLQQTKEFQMLQDQISEMQSDIDALKQYIVSLGDLEKQVKQTLKLPGSSVTLESILASSANKPKLQSYTQIPQTLTVAKTTLTDVVKQATDTEETLETLNNFAYTFNLLKAQTPDYWPIQGVITSSFGWRTNPLGRGMEFHSGIDIVGDYGAPIRAAGEGQVVFTGWDTNGYGKMIVISHRDGIESVYGHLSSIGVSIGDKVKKGEIIGYEGNSGEATGPHLHFEIRENGTPVNPLKYLQ